MDQLISNNTPNETTNTSDLNLPYNSIIAYYYLYIALAGFIFLSFFWDLFIWIKYNYFKKIKVVYSVLVLISTVVTTITIWRINLVAVDHDFDTVIAVYSFFLLAYQYVDLWLLSIQIVIIKHTIPKEGRQTWKKNRRITFGILFSFQFAISAAFFSILFTGYISKWPDLFVSFLVLFFDSILYACASIYTSVTINSIPKTIEEALTANEHTILVSFQKKQLLVFAATNTVTKFLFYLSLNCNELFGTLYDYKGALQFVFQAVDILCNVVVLRYVDVRLIVRHCMRSEEVIYNRQE